MTTYNMIPVDTTDTLKTELLDNLFTWIRQRPGLDYGNYGDPTSYRAELRHIRKDLHHARTLLRAVELSSLSGDTLLQAFRAFSGRMEWKNGHLEYCTGQYWPTEYRKVVCAIAAQALWDHYREDFSVAAKPGESAGEAIRRKFRQMFGRSIQTRWFN
jgi:hypothetical protein